MKLRVALLLAVFLVASVASADRIRLKNGKSFDDVVLLESTETTIRFRLASGEMSLPADWVESIAREKGALAEYLERRTALVEAEATSASAWLDLARWARVRDVDHGFRESLLAASEIDPGLEGLAPMMAAIDYVLDSERGVWKQKELSRSASVQPRRAVEDRAVAAGPDHRVAEGLTRAIETLAEAELERTRTRSQRVQVPRVTRRTVYAPTFSIAAVPFGLTRSGWVFPGEPLRGAGSDPDNPVVRRPANAQARALLSRPPGSLLPVSAYRD